MELQEVSGSGAGLISSAEIDQQVATAHRFPRSIDTFREEVRAMVTLNEKVAGECIYALPRADAMIEGPSARLAEIIANAWGNSLAGARIVYEDDKFVTSQGVFHDLQKNTKIVFECRRRITTKSGKRFGDDMIATTANAASSIALRNAILKGVPKAFWSEYYDLARQTAKGDSKTLATSRIEALKYLLGFGATEEMVLNTLDVQSVEDITQDHLAVLRGIATAIKDGDTTVEEAFSANRSGKPDVEMPQAKSDK